MLSNHEQQMQQLISHRSDPTNSGDLQTISADVTPRIRPNTELITPRTNAAKQQKDHAPHDELNSSVASVKSRGKQSSAKKDL